MADLKNAQGSLLSFIEALSTEFGISPVNLDAVADEVDLPQGDFVGLESFSMASDNDNTPFAMVAGMITLGVRNDTNNMKLIDYLDKVFDRLQPEQLVPLFSMDTGDQIGDFKLIGTTRVLPITLETALSLQSVTFQAALQYAE